MLKLQQAGSIDSYHRLLIDNNVDTKRHCLYVNLTVAERQSDARVSARLHIDTER